MPMPAMNNRPDNSENLSPPATHWFRWIWVAVFAVAFAWVESAVVIDLRRIFFNGDFRFPLVIVREAGERIIGPLVMIEFGREIATLVVLAGKNRIQRFCYFMLAFGIWDIFYYIWLKVLTGWPESLMTWDLLFYVPLPWVGPVITPLLIAGAMILFGTWIIVLDEKGVVVRFRKADLILIGLCALLLIVSFCWDWKNILRFPDENQYTGIPTSFAWWLYLPALGVAVGNTSYRLIKVEKIE